MTIIKTDAITVTGAVHDQEGSEDFEALG